MPGTALVVPASASPEQCPHLPSPAPGLAAGSTIGFGGDAALGIGGQAFAQPHLFPRGIGNGIAKPAVGHLVDDIDDQELVTLQDGGDDKGEAGVLHGHDGEGGGKEDDVVPAPGGRVGQ